MARNATKDLSVYFLRGHYLDSNNASEPVISPQIWSEMLNAINALPISLSQYRAGRVSRYYMEKENFYGVLFYDRQARRLNPSALTGNLVYGITFKRRDTNWPFLENGSGAFDRIPTRNAEDSLAELTFFLLDKRRSVLLFVANPRATSTTVLENYLFKEWQNFWSFQNQPPTATAPSAIRLRFLMHPNAEEELTRMDTIKKIEIQLSGGDLLNEIYARVGQDPMDAAIRSGVEAARYYGSRVMRFSINVDSDPADVTTTNRLRRFMRNLQRGIRRFLNASPESRPSRANNLCSLSGKIDEESRTINLLEDKLLVKTQMEFTDRYLDFGEVFDRLYAIYEREEPVFTRAMDSDNDPLE